MPLQVQIEPRQEWAQILDEVWRINRDYFYAPNMHGADWKAMKQKYSAFLPDLGTRADLNRLIQWMCSSWPWATTAAAAATCRDTGKAIPGGLLGADLDVANGRYRFTKIFGGLNWNPELRSPLTEPGVNVKSGEYLLAVNGRDLAAPDNLHARFENTAGKLVELTVGADPTGKGARTVTVVPVESEAALRNRDWVEGNLKKVHDATEGRVAYVQCPTPRAWATPTSSATSTPGLEGCRDHRRALQRRRPGGGLLHRPAAAPFIAMWAMRYGQDLKTPRPPSRAPRSCSWMRPPVPGATCCPGCSGSSVWVRWWAVPRGAASSASSASPP
ncbi:MAG: PDZ domain-containing protein [Holophagaceae bacterium]|nr:PDZ domain-containing protein [Holophagaceae bacterium]